MKTIIRIAAIVCAIIIGIGATGCRRTSHNGKIDGFWQLRSLEYTQTGQVVDKSESDLYFCINLELMQLRYGKEVATGVMDYDKSAHRLGVDFRAFGLLEEHNQTDYLAAFGVMENPVVFEVVKAGSHTLVLKTPETIITCRRF